MAQSPLTRRVLTIRGRVQGVGFRWFARESAEALGLSGWARNCADGSVEIQAEGKPEALERYELEMRRGPMGARVDAVEIQTAPATGNRGFEIKQ